MKIETIGGAVIATTILLVTGFLALYQQEGVANFSDISEAAWVVLGGGAALSFLKDYQAISTRKTIAKLRRAK